MSRNITQRSVRKLSRRASICLLCLAFLLQFAPPVGALDQEAKARSVIDRHVEAVGGRSVVAGHVSRHYHGTIEVQGLQGAFDVYRAEGKFLLRIEIEAVGTILQGFDGRFGWEQGQRGERILEGRELEQVVAQSNPLEETKPRQLYPKATYLGSETLDGTVYDKVELVTTAGAVLHEYFDQDTGIRRRSITLNEGGDETVELLFDDYREFDGHLIATRLTQKAAGQTILRIVEGVSFEPLQEELFEMPDEVAAVASP